MTISEDERAHDIVPVTFPSATRLDLLIPFLCGAGRRPCSERPGGYPVFLVSEGSTVRRPPAAGHELRAARPHGSTGPPSTLERRSAPLCAATVGASAKIAVGPRQAS